jgi:hypothetical protein
LFPVWSRNGKELLFHEPVTNRLLSAPYTAGGDSFTAGEAKIWKDVRVQDLLRSASYDSAPGGDTVVLIQPLPAANLRPTLAFLLNFFDELRRREREKEE